MNTCRVCELLDNDIIPKDCKWCTFCKAWLCTSCWNDWKRRAKAAWKELGFNV